MSVDGSPTAPPSARRSGMATVALTVVVVLVEFALLFAVYHRGDHLRAERVTVASLTGGLAAVAPGSAPLSSVDAQQAVASTRAVVDRLSAEGLSAASLRPLRAAAAALADHPDRAPVVRTHTAAEQLSARLAHEEAVQDREADAVYVVLLLVASVGWMLWFRKLVARHRALEREITEERARGAGEARLAAVMHSAADLVCIVDPDSTVTYATPSALTVLGTAPEDLVGRSVTDLVVRDDADILIHLLGSVRAGAEQDVQLRVPHADGRELFAEGVLTSLFADTSISGFVLTLRDITERRQLEERLSHQAFHDSLTGLANRQLFADRLQHALNRRSSGGNPHVVLFCDLDDFKIVNDRLGHVGGDAVLAAVGERIRSVIRPADTAARLGGDEFAILLEDVAVADARAFAVRLQDVLRQPLLIDEVATVVQASVGVAPAVPGEGAAEDVLRNADVAMYWAKDRGKATVAVYESELHAQARERLDLRVDLQRALTEQELVLHFQPTVDLQTGAVAGFEALVRWMHPERGLVPPAAFIDLAEQTGLIVPLGRWVLFEACRAAATMQVGSQRPSMAVNLSPLQLASAGIVAEVSAALDQAGLPADRLVLEITEGVLLADPDAVTPTLAALRALGVRIALDDFGTGYSSLSYLTQLPLDILKIDKSFVDRVTVDQQDAAVTEAIIAMSRAMTLTTVAEGVEEEAQAAWLRSVRCTLGQGYLWSRPVPLAQAMALLTPPARSLGRAPSVG